LKSRRGVQHVSRDCTYRPHIKTHYKTSNADVEVFPATCAATLLVAACKCLQCMRMSDFENVTGFRRMQR